MMKLFSMAALLLVAGGDGRIAAPDSAVPERVRINDNRNPAGTLRKGVLTLDLEARIATWHPDADDDPGVDVQAFAEVGHQPQIPGPLIRVPAGTTVDLTIRNAVSNTTLVAHGLSSRSRRGAADVDSVQVPFGAARLLHFRLDVPGTYYYWGTTTGRRLGVRIHEDAQLSGAIVVDPPQTKSAAVARDRIFVIGLMGDTTGGENIREDRKQLLFVINGRSWPHTERLSYNLGDTIRWRVLNTTVDPHPMHLHGAYYRVENRGDGARDTSYAPDERDIVNTELLPPGATMTMSWSPEHEGNWLFHCHIPEHFGPRGPLGTLRPAHNDEGHRIANHALEGMSGLVMGVTVRSHNGTSARTGDSQRRRLRLLVRTNGGSTAASPFYGFTLHERGPVPSADSGFRIGPPIVLVRGQPVGIMVVNGTGVPTAIHWHGIELESYYDGVAGFSGTVKRLAPVIAAGDSFEARFTPPRAGTFMYHTHIDESRQQRAGLAGPLLVLEPGRVYDPATDIPILISSPSDAESEARSVLLNGVLTPSPLDLRRGTPYRLRFGNITTGRPGMRIEMRRDSVLAIWTPLAKDGAELPISRRVPRPARHSISIGETADFQFTPALPGPMRLEMLTASGRLLGTVLIRVH
jgi:FtsP/CotA-like multicopper oxidase with cupredoxin domain